MTSRKISIGDIPIGKPLQFDAYGSDGGLLLRKGQIIANDRMAVELLTRGLYVEASASGDAALDKNAPVKQVEIRSVLRMIVTARNDARTLLYNLAAESNASEKLLALASQIVLATKTDFDVALGCILLEQEGSYGARHCVDTALISILIARAMKKPEDEIVLLCAAALTMNLSMVRLHDKLQEKTEPLNAGERQFIERHPENSVKLLREAGVSDEDWISWILSHHEHENSTGYPGHKLGLDIPRNAKILSVADTYTACISNRKYRKTLLPNVALREIVASSKSTTEPMMAALLIRELGAYPIGSYVRLLDGEIGVVTSKGSSPTTPYVHTLIGARGAPLAAAIKRDTQQALHGVRDVLYREQLVLKFTMRQLWGEAASL